MSRLKRFGGRALLLVAQYALLVASCTHAFVNPWIGQRAAGTPEAPADPLYVAWVGPDAKGAPGEIAVYPWRKLKDPAFWEHASPQGHSFLLPQCRTSRWSGFEVDVTIQCLEPGTDRQRIKVSPDTPLTLTLSEYWARADRIEPVSLRVVGLEHWMIGGFACFLFALMIARTFYPLASRARPGAAALGNYLVPAPDLAMSGAERLRRTGLALAIQLACVAVFGAAALLIVKFFVLPEGDSPGADALFFSLYLGAFVAAALGGRIRRRFDIERPEK